MQPNLQTAPVNAISNSHYENNKIQSPIISNIKRKDFAWYQIKKRDGKSHNFSPQMVTCYEYLTTINIRNQRGGLYQDHIKVWCLRFYTCVPTRTVVNGYTTPLRIYKENCFRN